jgi:phospholipid:diacylglycerol acyltransferase
MLTHRHRYTRGDYEFDDVQPDVADATCPDHDSADCGSPRPALDMPLSRKSWIDFECARPATRHPESSD